MWMEKIFIIKSFLHLPYTLMGWGVWEGVKSISYIFLLCRIVPGLFICLGFGFHKRWWGLDEIQRNISKWDSQDLNCSASASQCPREWVWCGRKEIVKFKWKGNWENNFYSFFIRYYSETEESRHICTINFVQWMIFSIWNWNNKKKIKRIWPLLPPYRTLLQQSPLTPASIDIF